MKVSKAYLDAAADNVQQFEKMLLEQPLHFSYGKATYNAFAKTYTSTSYLSNKITAIPAACRDTIFAIYHLAKAALYGVAKLFMGDALPLKTNIYLCARDLEMVLGSLITLVHDSYGQYLFEDGQFHQRCYDMAGKQPAARPEEPNPNKPFSYSSFRSYTEIDGIEVPYHSEAYKLSLLDFRKMSEEEQGKAIEKFKLQESIDTYGKEAFFAAVRDANEEVLQTVSFVDARINREGVLKYALMKDEELKKVTLKELSELRNPPTNILLKRKELLKVEEEASLPQDLLELPFIHFSSLKAEILNQNIKSMPLAAFPFITDEQIKGMNLSLCSADQLKVLFSAHNTTVDRRRFALLPTDQVNKILKFLNKYQMSLISDAQMQALDLSILDSDGIQRLFNNYSTTTEDRRRFALLPTDQVSKILKFLNKYQMSLISDAQLQALDLSILDSDGVQRLFNNYSTTAEDRRRFALLPTDQVNKILKFLNKYQMSLISDAQMQALDLSTLDSDGVQRLFNNYSTTAEDRRRFALLPTDQVNKILKFLNKYQMSLISDAQMQALDLSTLDSDGVQRLFNNYSTTAEDRRRCALLPADVLAQNRHKFSTKYLKSLLL